MAQDAALGSAHGAPLGGGVVVETGEVEEAVDEVKGEFVGGRAAGLAGDDDGALGADDDFAEAVAEIEADDIGWAGVVEKALIEVGDGRVVHEGDAEFAERIADGSPLYVGGYDRGGAMEELKQSFPVEAQVALEIAETD